MLSYRHAFHAGNHGDVLKHTVLARVLEYITQKDNPILYLDTHAGAGKYDLTQSMPQKTGEAIGGVSRIWEARHDTIPIMLQPYLETLHAYNQHYISGKLHLYPGSPLLAQRLLRHTDRAVCYERHPTDYRLLADNLRADHRFVATQADGLSGLRAQLPPKERRGLILFDPSYERDREYLEVLAALQEALRRFATGVYILWYPLLEPRPPIITRFLRTLSAMQANNTLNIELILATSNLEAGLIGSGLWLINPPWLLRQELQTALPWIAQRLGGVDTSWRIG